MTLGKPRPEIGHNRNRVAAGKSWDIRLVSVGLIGALAGGLYATFPYSGGRNLPDSYLLRIDTAIGDVTPLDMESLAQTVITAKAQSAAARDRR